MRQASCGERPRSTKSTPTPLRRRSKQSLQRKRRRRRTHPNSPARSKGQESRITEVAATRRPFRSSPKSAVGRDRFGFSLQLSSRSAPAPLAGCAARSQVPPPCILSLDCLRRSFPPDCYKGCIGPLCRLPHLSFWRRLRSQEPSRSKHQRQSVRSNWSGFRAPRAASEDCRWPNQELRRHP